MEKWSRKEFLSLPTKCELLIVSPGRLHLYAVLKVCEPKKGYGPNWLGSWRESLLEFSTISICLCHSGLNSKNCS